MTLFLALLLCLLPSAAFATFPTIVGVSHSHQGSDATAITVALPDGSNVIGRRVIVLVSKDGSGAPTFPGTWSSITNCDGADGSNATYGRAYYRDIDGTEGFDGSGDTISVTGASEEYAATAVLLSGHHSGAPECAKATQTTNDMDAPALTPSWGAADTLWMVYGTLDGSRTIAGYPTNYSSNQHGDAASVNATSVTHAFATRAVNASSQDPGTFSNTFDSSVIFTVAVRPAGAAKHNSRAVVVGQ